MPKGKRTREKAPALNLKAQNDEPVGASALRNAVKPKEIVSTTAVSLAKMMKSSKKRMGRYVFIPPSVSASW